MNGTRNDNGICIYLDDDMMMTEGQMLAAFGLVGMSGQTNPDRLWTNGVIPVKFDRTQIAENGDEEQLVWSVAADFNGDLDGCLSIVYVSNLRLTFERIFKKSFVTRKYLVQIGPKCTVEIENVFKDNNA